MLGLGAALVLGACATSSGEGGSSSEGPAPEVLGPYGIEGYRSLHALFYVVPVAGGVFLVDTGYDDDGGDVLAALQGRRPFAVFVTHGHVDHWAGAWALGDLPTFVGAADIPRIRGEEVSAGLIPGLGDRFLPAQRPPLRMVPVDDGARIGADQVGAPGAWEVQALHLPGHTTGSTAWLYGDVLFSGDALLGDGESLGFAPPGFSDDADQALRSLTRLRGVPFETLLDGHAGRADGGTVRLERFLEEEGAR